MTEGPGRAHEVVRASIATVAPDVDVGRIPGNADFRIVAALDSMDFIAVLDQVLRRTGVEVPELDYPLVRTIDGFATYLVDRSG